MVDCNGQKIHNTGGYNLKKHKKFYLLLIVLIIGSLFTGCNKEEKDLMDAFIKSQEMLKLESTSNMKFNLNVEGLDDETQVIFDGFVNQINDMKISISQKSVTNEERTVSKAQVDANVQLTDMSFDSSIWVDMDMSGEKLVLKEIFKVPSILMGLIPGATEKEYIVLDFDTMNESIANIEEDMPDPMDFGETMAIAMKYQDKFKDAFVDYIKDYDFDLSVVTKLGDKTVDGEKIKYYQVKFDNDSFKDFLKYTTISMLKDKSIISLFEEYMTELMSASGEKMPEELSITDNIGEMVQKTTEFFKKLEDLTILGEDGILITYGINKDGYFVSEEGKIDFKMDTKQFKQLISDSIEENQSSDEALMVDNEFLKEMPTPIFELSISYDTKINSINKDTKIKMPNITEKNSIDYMELIKTMVSEIPQDMELMVFIEDELVEFTNEPILVDRRYLVSSRDIAAIFDASIAWNGATKEITIVKDENQLIFNTNNNQLVVNGASQTLNTSVVVIDGLSFIPLRTVSENLGYSVDWDGELKMISIYK